VPAVLRGPTSACPTHEVLADFVQGKLGAVEASLVRSHLEVCTECLADFDSRPSGTPHESGAVDASPICRFRPGDLIRGKYRVDDVLGGGGMGTVLRAFHVALERPVAIKLMHPALVADPEASRRFTGEARAAARLESAHAVRILDIDVTPVPAPPGREGAVEVPFIVMELLEGEDLHSTIDRDGPIPWRVAIEYMLQALEAVAEAHDRGIVHRDLKPQNLFLTQRGVVKVVDFGLAKTLSLGSAVPSNAGSGTQTKVMMGSPHYMSPEQIRSARRVDSRADIWALGASLRHMVAGVPPYAAPNLFLLCARIINEPPPPIPPSLGVPSAIEAIVARCMAKNPADRYATCAEVSAALSAALTSVRSLPPVARGSGPVPTAARAQMELDVTNPLSTVDGEIEVDFSDAPEYQFDEVTVKTESGMVDITQPLVRPRR
jgi:serine/threonine-protein kinase